MSNITRIKNTKYQIILLIAMTFCAGWFEHHNLAMKILTLHRHITCSNRQLMGDASVHYLKKCVP